jgi:hypothetical protein
MKTNYDCNWGSSCHFFFCKQQDVKPATSKKQGISHNDINKAMSSYFDGLYHPFLMFWGWFTIALGTLRRELWHNFADYYNPILVLYMYI